MAVVVGQRPVVGAVEQYLCAERVAGSYATHRLHECRAVSGRGWRRRRRIAGVVDRTVETGGVTRTAGDRHLDLGLAIFNGQRLDLHTVRIGKRLPESEPSVGEVLMRTERARHVEQMRT